MIDCEVEQAWMLLKGSNETAREHELASHLHQALTDRDVLIGRRDELLALCAKLSRETPYASELEECRSARAALIAEVGTLRAELAEMREKLEWESDVNRALLESQERLAVEMRIWRDAAMGVKQ